MHARSIVVALLASATLLGGTSPAAAGRWDVVTGDGTEVVFHSRATMESFDGKTGAVEGWIELDPAAPAEGIAWELRVDLREVDTGIGLRNRHMRENHLHTDEHPWAVFRGEQVAAGAAALVASKPVSVKVEGAFELHGVTRPMALPVQLELQPDGSLRVSAEFGVSLEEHEIPRPKFLMLKLADVQEVEVRLLARPAREDS